MVVADRHEGQTPLRIENLRYQDALRVCDLCGHGVKWCYTVRDDAGQAYIIGRQCAAKHVSPAEARAWGAYFRRAQKEWSSVRCSGETKIAHIERRVNELATPRDIEAAIRKRRAAHGQELITYAVQQRLREIQKMSPGEREGLNLRAELMGATFRILWQQAYSEVEIGALIEKRYEMIEKSLMGQE